MNVIESGAGVRGQITFELLVAARQIDPERNCCIGGSGEANHGFARRPDTTGHDSSYAKRQVRDSHGATGHGLAEQGSSPLDNIVAAMSAAFKQRSSQNHVYCEPAIEALCPSSTAAAFCRSYHFRSWLAQYEAYGVPAAKRCAFFMNSLEPQAWRAVQLLRRT